MSQRIPTGKVPKNSASKNPLYSQQSCVCNRSARPLEVWRCGPISCCITTATQANCQEEKFSARKLFYQLEPEASVLRRPGRPKIPRKRGSRNGGSAVQWRNTARRRSRARSNSEGSGLASRVSYLRSGCVVGIPWGVPIRAAGQHPRRGYGCSECLLAGMPVLRRTDSFTRAGPGD